MEEAWRKWIDEFGKRYNVYETNAAKDAFEAAWKQAYDAGYYDGIDKCCDADDPF